MCKSQAQILHEEGLVEIYEEYYLDGRKNFYKKHTTYFTMLLLSEITKNELELLKTNFSMHVSNTNLNPTVFIDPLHENLYIYYSNIKEETQCYRLNPAFMNGLFPDADITFGEATINCVDALQPYSTSGRNALYEINLDYNPEPYPVEITQIWEDQPNDPVCGTSFPADQRLTVLPHTFGYIKVPIVLDSRMANAEKEVPIVTIYPNPASGYFMVSSNIGEFEKQNISIEIYSTIGNILQHLQTTLNNLVDISDLPAGYYNVKIFINDTQQTIIPLIKL